MGDAIINCDFDMFENLTEILAERIHLQEGDAIAVLNASRNGGVFLGRMMELWKGVEIFELNYSVQKAEGAPIIDFVGPFPPGLTNRRVFLLTEMLNSGLIASRAVEDLIERNNKVFFGSIYYRIESIIPEGIINYIYLIMVDCPVRFSHWELG